MGTVGDRSFDFDVIVVGGGHAGIEAALAATRMGCRVALVTLNRESIGRMSCNPAIGGLAKGQLVMEIDALGGEMGFATDLAGIQFRLLNRSKGPAVQSRRAQCDRALYSTFMIQAVSTQPGLEIIEGEVCDILDTDGECFGVVLSSGIEISCRATIITSGTFLNGLIHIGLDKFVAGRMGEPAAVGLSRRLSELGIQTGRLKTGTPPRLDGQTIDFSPLEIQRGDNPPPYFSARSDHSRALEQVVCHLTYTNEKTHELIRQNLDFSPLYSGQIKGIGPRYCPSVEDKVVRFAERHRHQLFLEPEGLNNNEYYLNGFSSSLPAGIQLAALHTIIGLEKAQMTRPGYAIEYDFFPPHQIMATLESKIIPNLYFAGQVNGTSGYEEAAAQGLMAGINAVLKIRGEPPFRLSRSEAYIGVLLDDLVTKSTSEPYRMFTSRAEYRLNLRDDNAQERLTEKGHRLGLVRPEVYRKYEEKLVMRSKLKAVLRERRIKIDTNRNGVRETISAFDALRNPAISLEKHETYREFAGIFGSELLQSLASEIRYEGYIARQDKRIERQKKHEDYRIPLDFDYGMLVGLKKEAAQKLSHFRPETLGQASRISGVSPGDIAILMIYLHRG